ncbi:hypothetical protein MedDCM-OCT-S13-C2-cds5 [uncultured Mediterranean phage MEDS1 group]|nr:hypothetical protein MedDCM-OCT-S13-C2-cds5 [uncultured Mediterranean phage MEDS1 group]BAR29965.1 hypothetical protein [uncultured Mediterranean phage uvMED]BAR29988.1 hypothetical protein [uncultured Mediterranean phage uvMED]BAR30012.1 hypothetical protein [uncultured Mediterranean phage uvMED]BAR30036.1 hypothetical protein [uncultured Mediterranean phage uvMED]
MKKKIHSSKKLEILKENRIQRLEKELLDDELKGYDHYVFINQSRRAQVITDGKWVTENIRTSVLKHNYKVQNVSKMLIKDFTDEEIKEYEKTFLSD